MMMGGSRDSDDSFPGNRPSTTCTAAAASNHPPNIFETAYKQSALRRVNAILSAHSFPLSFSLKPLPSARDIAETLKFILFRLEFQSSKLDDDLPVLLKSLNCPHKINRSALKAPGTPHAFPHLLAVLHWLVQIAEFKDDLSPPDPAEGDYDALNSHSLRCFSHFMQGDDDAADALKTEFFQKIYREKCALKENVQAFDRDVVELEAKLADLRSDPSPLEVLELAKQDLEKGVMKLTDFVSKLSDGMDIMQKAVKEKERELEEAVDEKEKIIKETEDLRREVQEQEIDLWAADRMKRELHTLVREIKEAEFARSESEDKCWSLDLKISQQFKMLEALIIKSNQALKRLKLGSDLQYRLNSEGSTVEQVLGTDYRSTIKPAINSLTNEIKKSSMANSEELLVLQMQNVQINNKFEAKKKQIAEIEHSIEAMKAGLNSMDKEIQDKKLRYKAEAEYVLKAVEAETQNLDIQHREAMETLKAAELKFQESEKRSKDEVQTCTYELFALIDSVSKHKEYMARKIHEMNNDLCETVDSLPKVCKQNMSPKSMRQTPTTKGR